MPYSSFSTTSIAVKGSSFAFYDNLLVVLHNVVEGGDPSNKEGLNNTQSYFYIDVLWLFSTCELSLYLTRNPRLCLCLCFNLDSWKVQSGKLTHHNPSNQMLSRVSSFSDSEECHLEFCSAHVQ